MQLPTFQKLNDDWNADPNAPDEQVSISGSTVELSFYLDHLVFKAGEDERGQLLFNDCRKWRLGHTNDEGWCLGQCRYSKIAPDWGAFYEITGPDEVPDHLDDWETPTSVGKGQRHFFFYLKDNTFECFADDWRFERLAMPPSTAC